MKISYSWLKWYVPELPEASSLADVFTYHLAEVESVEEVEGDTVYDINILPNRAHDLLSHRGIALELAGQLGLAYKDPSSEFRVPASVPTKLAVGIETASCRRYMGRIVRNVKVGPSPEWVVKHLASIGQRSINNIVDATNIVLFDCGQPAHAFDLKKVKNEKLIIRTGKSLTSDFKSEGIYLLGNTSKIPVLVKETDILIADEENVLAIAGIKGGVHAEVEDSTTDIILEVANFAPSVVRKTARRLGIFTDAAKRFENDLSPELAPYAMRELSALILEMCPEAVFEDVVDAYPKAQEPRSLSFDLRDVNAMLGSNIAIEDAETIFKDYGFDFTREGETFALSVPMLRLDLVGTHDVAEELGRIMGYDKLAPSIPKIEFLPKKNATHERIVAAREKLLALGYSETITYTFGKKGAVEVARGAKGKEFLRTNLSDGLKASYELNRLNAPLLGMDEVKVFEIGTVFASAGLEETHVACADKRGVTEMRLEEFMPDGEAAMPAARQTEAGRKFAEWSAFPFIARDIAVFVPLGTGPEELVSLCAENGTALLARPPRLFDQFTKGDRTSLAVRLVFQSPERTLTDADVAPIMSAITQEIAARGWEVR